LASKAELSSWRVGSLLPPFIRKLASGTPTAGFAYAKDYPLASGGKREYALFAVDRLTYIYTISLPWVQGAAA